MSHQDGLNGVVDFESLPRAIKMPSKRLSQPSSSHLQLLNGLPLDFVWILPRFIDHFGDILGSKIVSQIRSRSCDLLRLICCSFLRIRLYHQFMQTCKNHSKTYGFYTFALTLSFHASRSYRQQESKKSDQNTSIFWLKNLIKIDRNRNRIRVSTFKPFL